MQFAQQKRMQDIQIAGQRLELLHAANTQMMGSQSESFIEDTGLEGIYLQTLKGTGEDADQSSSVKAMSNLLTKSVSKGGWNIPAEAADKIVGAVYASKAGNHSGVLTIGKEMYEYAQTGHDYNTLGKNLAIQFPKIGKDISLDRLGQIYQTVNNQRNILKEMFDFDVTMHHIVQMSSFPEDHNLLVDETFTHAKNGWLYITYSNEKIDRDLISKMHTRININMKPLVIIKPHEGIKGLLFQTSLFKLLNGNKTKIYHDQSVDTRSFLDKVDEMPKDNSNTVITWSKFNEA